MLLSLSAAMCGSPESSNPSWRRARRFGGAQVAMARIRRFSPPSAGGKRVRDARVVLALAGQILPSDLKQAGSAIRAVNQVQQREHDRTSLFDQWREMLRTDRFGPLSSATENGFAARKNGFFGTPC